MSFSVPIRLVAIYLFTWLLTTTGFAQIPRSLDSLMVYLRTAPADSLYLKAQTDATFQLIYKRADYGRGDSLARQQIVLAQRLANWPSLVKAHTNRATAAYLKGDYQQALGHFQQALQSAEQHPVSPVVRYQALGNVATGYDKLNQPEKTMEAALRAVKWQEQNQIRPRFPTPHRLIGGALVKMGRTQQALPYYQHRPVRFSANSTIRAASLFSRINWATSTTN